MVTHCCNGESLQASELTQIVGIDLRYLQKGPSSGEAQGAAGSSSSMRQAQQSSCAAFAAVLAVEHSPSKAAKQDCEASEPLAGTGRMRCRHCPACCGGWPAGGTCDAQLGHAAFSRCLDG